MRIRDWFRRREVSEPRQRLEQAPPRTDLEQLGIDTLRAKGTPFAAGLADEIERGRERRERLERETPETRRERYEIESQREREARTRLLECLRPASTGEYVEVLSKWVLADGKVHHYDRPMRDVWVATSSLHVEPLHGTNAVNVVIIPNGFVVTGREPGHTDLVWNDGRRSLGFHGRPAWSLPAFSDARPHGARQSETER